MIDYEHLIEEYSRRFPKIPIQVHRGIINAALTGSPPTMEERGFRDWYDVVAPCLPSHMPEANSLARNPSFEIHRETMILGGDWIGVSILEIVTSA